MSLADRAQAYTPKENSEFGQNKKLVGDAVAQVKLEKFTSKKGVEYIKVVGEVINAIPDAKGRETTVEVGDEITKLYDTTNDEKMDELMDDLFTAGITYEKTGDADAIFNAMKASAADKLVYFRTWAKDKSKEELAKNSASTFWQNIKILSSNKLTEENCTPQVAF